METVREELARLAKEGNLGRLTEIREAMEDTRESVFAIVDRKLDLQRPIHVEQKQMSQINANIALVTETIKSIS